MTNVETPTLAPNRDSSVVGAEGRCADLTLTTPCLGHRFGCADDSPHDSHLTGFWDVEIQAWQVGFDGANAVRDNRGVAT